MGFLRSIFGPSKEEIWRQISNEIGGEYIDGGFWGKDALIYQHEEWEIVLDTYTVSNSHGKNRSSTSYTRMRAPFVNKDGLYFNIYRSCIFSPIGKLFGLQDIVVGDEYFDKEFVIKGNDPEKIKLLLSYDRLKDLMHEQPHIRFKIKDDEGFFSRRFPEGVDELYFETTGIIKDTHQLKSLFEMFALTLQILVQIDSAYEEDPNFSLV